METKDPIESNPNGTKLNRLQYLFEFIFTSILCFVLAEIQSSISYSDGIKRIRYFFNIIMFIILFMEWIRRKQAKGRPIYENYIYVVILISALFIGVYLMRTFYSETEL